MLENRPAELQDRSPEVLSFRAVIVMTKKPGHGQPTLADVEAALKNAGMKFVMPSAPEGTIVIAVNEG